MGFWQLVRRAKEFWSWYSFAVGTLGLAVTGVGIAVGGAVWLLKSGVPLPIAIMAGYCTLVGAVYLTMAPLAYRALKQEPSKKLISAVRASCGLETEDARLSSEGSGRYDFGGMRPR